MQMRSASIGSVVALLAIGASYQAGAVPAANSIALKPAIGGTSIVHEAQYWGGYGYGYPRYWGYRYPRYYYGYGYPSYYGGYGYGYGYGRPYYRRYNGYPGYYRPFRRYYW